MAIVTPHDKFFKSMMSDPRVAKDFFQYHLPEYIKKDIDWDSLHLEKESYLDEELDLNRTDLVFSVMFKGQRGFLYILVEHQSTSDPIMSFRVVKYMFRVMQNHLDKTGSTILPIVFPLVFYHGESSYTHTRDLFDLFVDPILAKEILFQPFHLVDVTQITDEELKKHVWSGIMELTLKHVFARDIIPFFQDLMTELRKLEYWDAKDLASTTLFYIINTANIKDKKKFEQIIHNTYKNTGEPIMTYREHCIAEGMEKGIEKGIEKGRVEGIQKGRKEGLLEVAKNALRQGLSLETIKKLTGLSNTDIEKLNKVEI